MTFNNVLAPLNAAKKCRRHKRDVTLSGFRGSGDDESPLQGREGDAAIASSHQTRKHDENSKETISLH